MINLFSIQCSLAFAPYLLDCFSTFLNTGSPHPKSVRQGGLGFVIGGGDKVKLRHQGRETGLGRVEVDHFNATVEFRSRYYEILRMQDEVVLADVGRTLLLSHPQSDLWLEKGLLEGLVSGFRSGACSVALPDWITCSMDGNRVLLSDQRNGRWVLLGQDHMDEIQRRLPLLDLQPDSFVLPSPPVFSLKGVSVHLQSMFRLAKALDTFGRTRNVEPYEETAPRYRLSVDRAMEGIEIKDSETRAGLTPREAAKYAEIITGELESMSAEEFERSLIRTVIASSADGDWVLQAGDEVLIRPGHAPSVMSGTGSSPDVTGNPVVDEIGDWTLLLDPSTGACVALDRRESKSLAAKGETST